MSRKDDMDHSCVSKLKFIEQFYLTCLSMHNVRSLSECTQPIVDLMFVVDGSESITHVRFKTVKQWIVNVASGFDISETVQIGVVSTGKTSSSFIRSTINADSLAASWVQIEVGLYVCELVIT